MRHAQNAAAQGASQIVFATASYDHTIRFWEVHSGKSWLTIKASWREVLLIGCSRLQKDA